MKKKYPIGGLRHRIMFQKEIKIADGLKGHSTSWQDVIAVWGSITPLRGVERFYAHQIKSEVSHRVRIRYRDDVSELMRITQGERIFTIESMLDIEEKRQILEFLCQEEK